MMDSYSPLFKYTLNPQSVLCNFECFLSSAALFSKSPFFEEIFQDYHLGPNCLQRLSADNTCGQSVNALNTSIITQFAKTNIEFQL